MLGGTILAGPLTSQRASARTPLRANALGADPFVAEIMIFAGNFAPRGYATCGGQLLPISQNTALFSLLGTTYGGDGKSTFALPDLRGRVPIGVGQGPGLSDRLLGEAGGEETVTLNTTQIPSHNHSLQVQSNPGTSNNRVGKNLATNAEGIGQFGGTPGTPMNGESLSSTGGDQPHNNMPPYLTLNYCIAMQGVFPPRSSTNELPQPALERPTVSVDSEAAIMSTPYVGETRLFAGNFAPAGWMICEGQLLSIAENETLFQLIGTTYGGDGQSTFGLPDLRSRVPIAAGGTHIFAETGGAEENTLTTNQLPSHTHALQVSSGVGTSVTPGGKFLAANAEGVPQFGAGVNANMHSASIASTGGSQPHNNMPPYLGINYIISLFGVFPSPT